MNKYEEFVKYFDQLVENSHLTSIPPEIAEVRTELINQGQILKEKPLLTESGFQILQYFQSVSGKKMKASDIAQGMNVSSRKISGAIRKLVADNFVEKFGSNPVIYSLTEKGKKFDLEKYMKETCKNEEDD